MISSFARFALVLTLVLAGCGDDDPPTGVPTVTDLTSGVAVSGISGAEDSQRRYRIPVTAGATGLLITTTGGSGDVDMYVRRGAVPTPASAVDCASDEDFTEEVCDIPSPAAGDWYIVLYGFEAYSGVTLTATVTRP